MSHQVLGDYRLATGPSKLNLMLSLFDGSPVEGTQRILNFITESGRQFNVRISGVDREDGSGESWIIRGYNASHSASNQWYSCNGYYNTQTRKGHLMLYAM